MTPRQAASCCRPVDDLLAPGFFKAMSDPTRVRLLGCLIKCGRPCTLGEVAECCSVDLSVVSRHLKALATEGLLEATRSGRSVSYAVRYDHISSILRGLAEAIEECAPTARAAECRGGACGCS